jgi:hypothetical protein
MTSVVFGIRNSMNKVSLANSRSKLVIGNNTFYLGMRRRVRSRNLLLLGRVINIAP